VFCCHRNCQFILHAAEFDTFSSRRNVGQRPFTHVPVIAVPATAKRFHSSRERYSSQRRIGQAMFSGPTYRPAAKLPHCNAVQVKMLGDYSTAPDRYSTAPGRRGNRPATGASVCVTRLDVGAMPGETTRREPARVTRITHLILSVFFARSSHRLRACFGR
jgi:hypothetical protein